MALVLQRPHPGNCPWARVRPPADHVDCQRPAGPWWKGRAGPRSPASRSGWSQPWQLGKGRVTKSADPWPSLRA